MANFAANLKKLPYSKCTNPIPTNGARLPSLFRGHFHQKNTRSASKSKSDIVVPYRSLQLRWWIASSHKFPIMNSFKFNHILSVSDIGSTPFPYFHLSCVLLRLLNKYKLIYQS